MRSGWACAVRKAARKKMKNYILSIDIGTSGAKVMLTDLSGRKLSAMSAGYATRSPEPNAYRQDPRDWWRAVREALPRLLSDEKVSPGDIGAIGVDGVSWTPVLLDEKGGAMCDSPLWYDTQSFRQCDELRERVGEEAAFSCSRNPLQPYYEDSKILRFRQEEPEKMKRCRHILSSNGYIGYRLTGEMRQDVCQAYGFLSFDMEKAKWNEALAEKAGFDLNLIAPLAACDEVIGTVTREAAEQTGLVAGIPVIAGGLDAACGALGAGVYAPGPVHEQSGSAGGMSVCCDVCPSAPGLIVSRHVVGGQWLLQGGTVGGGQLMNWLSDVLMPGVERGKAREALCAEAAKIPEGSDGLVFLPYMAGERSPIWDPNAKGTFVGLDFTKNRGHITRSVLEGAAFALRHNLETAAPCAPKMELLRAVGGASENALWMQMKADITGIPICAVDSPHATALGCAVLAGVGTGMLPGYDVINEYVSLREPYLPRKAFSEVYNERYEKYVSVYPRVADLTKGD